MRLVCILIGILIALGIYDISNLNFVDLKVDLILCIIAYIYLEYESKYEEETRITASLTAVLIGLSLPLILYDSTRGYITDIKLDFAMLSATLVLGNINIKERG